MRLFNDNWEFSKQPLHTSLEEMETRKEDFQPGIPHDWLIYQAQDLYEDGTGWYRKQFSWEKKEGEQVVLRFDGIYMDSTLYVNKKEVCQWKYGYSTFEVEITEFLQNG